MLCRKLAHQVPVPRRSVDVRRTGRSDEWSRRIVWFWSRFSDQNKTCLVFFVGLLALLACWFVSVLFWSFFIWAASNLFWFPTCFLVPCESIWAHSKSYSLWAVWGSSLGHWWWSYTNKRLQPKYLWLLDVIRKLRGTQEYSEWFLARCGTLGSTLKRTCSRFSLVFSCFLSMKLLGPGGNDQGKQSTQRSAGAYSLFECSCRCYSFSIRGVLFGTGIDSKKPQSISASERKRNLDLPRFLSFFFFFFSWCQCAFQISKYINAYPPKYTLCRWHVAFCSNYCAQITVHAWLWLTHIAGVCLKLRKSFKEHMWHLKPHTSTYYIIYIWRVNACSAPIGGTTYAKPSARRFGCLARSTRLERRGATQKDGRRLPGA